MMHNAIFADLEHFAHARLRVLPISDCRATQERYHSPEKVRGKRFFCF